jgi:hypothetical protein
MMRVSAALQKQASRDLEPIWNNGYRRCITSLEEVPDGYWPMIIKATLGLPAPRAFTWIRTAAVCTHRLKHYLDGWSLTASLKCEMLVDPSGDRQATGDSPMPGQER